MPNRLSAKRSRPRAATDNRSVEQRLADALAQQAATSEILRVMSASPTDVQPVMDAVAEASRPSCAMHHSRACSSSRATCMRTLAHYSVDGETRSR